MQVLALAILLTAAAAGVSAIYADNANELKDGSACRTVSFAWAKGTDENGNLGEADNVGPVLINALAALLPVGSTMAVQGVEGDFTIADFLEGGDSGAVDYMTDLVLSVRAVVILLGCSQVLWGLGC